MIVGRCSSAPPSARNRALSGRVGASVLGMLLLGGIAAVGCSAPAPTAEETMNSLAEAALAGGTRPSLGTAGVDPLLLGSGLTNLSVPYVSVSDVSPAVCTTANTFAGWFTGQPLGVDELSAIVSDVLLVPQLRETVDLGGQIGADGEALAETFIEELEALAAGDISRDPALRDAATRLWVWLTAICDFRVATGGTGVTGSDGSSSTTATTAPSEPDASTATPPGATGPDA